MYAIWVNTLCFLSLVISLTCALLATLLQQWARRYLNVTQSRYAPHKRARIRAFLAKGVEKLLPRTVGVLTTLLHISLFLFFAGLVVFLCNVNLTIFKFVLSWVGICTSLYGCITVIPILRPDSPYFTPLSMPAWHIVTGISFLIFRVLRRLALLKYSSGKTYRRFEYLAARHGNRLVQGMQKTVEEAALNSHRRSIHARLCGRSTVWTKITNWCTSFRACLAYAARKSSIILCPLSLKRDNRGFLQRCPGCLTAHSHPMYFESLSNTRGPSYARRPSTQHTLPMH